MLLARPRAEQRHLIRRALEAIARENIDLRYDVLERAVTFLAEGREGRCDLSGGVRLLREGELIFVTRAGVISPQEGWPQMSGQVLQVPLPGRVELPSGWHLRCETPEMAGLDLNKVQHCEDPFRAWLDKDSLPGDLHLRTRRPGDRIQPLGMGGRSMKLSDFFINEKLPKRARAGWPLLCGGDTIVWVPGYRLAHPFRVTRETRNLLALTLESD
jgi:tRNA(Ile)-lysidine synthase